MLLAFRMVVNCYAVARSVFATPTNSTTPWLFSLWKHVCKIQNKLAFGHDSKSLRVVFFLFVRPGLLRWRSVCACDLIRGVLKRVF